MFKMKEYFPACVIPLREKKAHNIFERSLEAMPSSHTGQFKASPS